MNTSDMYDKRIKCGHFWIYPLYTNVSSTDDMASDFAVCLVNIILAIFTTIGNACIISVYMKNSHLQTKNNLLIVAVALTDLVVGLWAQPSFVWVKITEMVRSIDCRIEIINDLTTKFCASVSLLTLGVVVSGERYLAVFHPFKHHSWLTKRKLLRATVVVWVGVTLFIISIPLGLHHRIYRPTGLVLIFISLIFSIGVYAKIANKLCKMKIQTRSADRSHSDRVARMSTAQQIKFAVTLFYVLSTLCITYFPMFGGLIYASIHGQNMFYQKFLWTWAVTFLYFNSFCNPFIYSWRNRHMSSAIRKLFVPERNLVIQKADRKLTQTRTAIDG